MRIAFPGVVLWLLASFATAASEAPTFDVEQAHARVKERSEAAYRDVLAEFDRAIAAAPQDAERAVRRCHFIAGYTDEDYGIFVDAAPDEHARCVEQVQALHAQEPLARLFLLEQVWGEEGIAQAEAQLEESKAWPRPQRGALLARLSQLHGYAQQPRQAADYALQALEHGDASRIDTVLKYQIERRDFARAAELIRTTPAAATAWDAHARIERALELPDPAAAVAELRRYDEVAFEVDREIAGRALLKAGDIEAAAALLDEAEGEYPALQQARFELALARGDQAAALEEIDFSDESTWRDNAMRLFALLEASPAAWFSAATLFALMLGAAIVIVIALAPGLVLIPAHYRGLVRRVRGKSQASLFEAAGLKRAWIGLALLMAVPIVIGMAVEPVATFDMIFSHPPTDAAATFRATLWGASAALLCVLLLARPLGARAVFGGLEVWRSLGWVVLGWLLVFAVGMLLVMLAGTNLQETEQTRMVRSLVEGGAASVGPVVTLLLVALVVPILEEVAFRGLLLGGLARHLSFAGANLLQALLFAVVHDDWPRFPYYLTMGLVAGWLVRRYRSVGPAIALHMLNNAIATALTLWR